MLSLDNNGGFASVRMPLASNPPDGLISIKLKVKGDGSRYYFRIRKEGSFDGIAYDLAFDTVKGEWAEIELPLADFRDTFRGRTFDDRRVESSVDIGQIGILIGNKQEGNFKLELDWIVLTN